MKRKKPTAKFSDVLSNETVISEAKNIASSPQEEHAQDEAETLQRKRKVVNRSMFAATNSGPAPIAATQVNNANNINQPVAGPGTDGLKMLASTTFPALAITQNIMPAPFLGFRAESGFTMPPSSLTKFPEEQKILDLLRDNSANPFPDLPPITLPPAALAINSAQAMPNFVKPGIACAIETGGNNAYLILQARMQVMESALQEKDSKIIQLEAEKQTLQTEKQTLQIENQILQTENPKLKESCKNKDLLIKGMIEKMRNISAQLPGAGKAIDSTDTFEQKYGNTIKPGLKY